MNATDIQSLNADFSQRIACDTARMAWTASPSGTVWRKRLHLYGPAESGQVTSVVRYQPDSRFPEHGHPEGEEILVLDGVFSDQAGDWPAGSYLLNPESFRHAPFSREGCVLFVKLRQYPGAERRHVARDAREMGWEQTATPGVRIKTLYAEDGYPETVRIVALDPGAEAPRQTYPGGAELFTLEGELTDESGRYAAGWWLRLPPGSAHRPASGPGCRYYLKTGALPCLRGPR